MDINFSDRFWEEIEFPPDMLPYWTWVNNLICECSCHTVAFEEYDTRKIRNIMRQCNCTYSTCVDFNNCYHADLVDK